MDEVGRTQLMLAVADPHQPAIEVYKWLRAGVDVNARDAQGLTPLLALPYVHDLQIPQQYSCAPIIRLLSEATRVPKIWDTCKNEPTSQIINTFSLQAGTKHARMRNMYKNALKICVLAGALLPCWGNDLTKELPAPVMTGGMPLMEAIAKRHSARDFDSTRAIDNQTLADILWVAWGKSPHGKRTIPTSRNLQNMQLFVLTPTGTWEYDGMAHTLRKVNKKNLIPLCKLQDFVKNAPLHLLYTCMDDRGGENHVGSAYQNVYLYCTSRGLSTVVRAMIDKDALKREIGLPENHSVIVHQCIGWPAK